MNIKQEHILDQEAAEKVMGYVNLRGGFFPSTRIADAWDLVTRLGVQGVTMHLEWKGANREFPLTAEVVFTHKGTIGWAVAPSAQEAICRAAIKAADNLKKGLYE